MNAEKRLLNDLLRILFVAHQANRKRERSALVPVDKLPETIHVTGLGAFDDGTILLRFSLP